MKSITTIVLNWNRNHLLKRTLDSYFSTVGAESELIVVDNGSSDGSREYLQSTANAKPFRVIFLDDNKGGEAYNLAIPLATGILIHLSENDQEFLPGWFEHVTEAFRIFDDLGQLSLFSDTPTDDEAWEPKPAHLRFRAGKILYEAHGNVGISSILRARLFHEKGLRVENIEHGTFRFPADGKLSSDVKGAGYWVAWSDRYYVQNVGHEISEFERYPSYYEQNYASKPWVGVDGWRSRIEKQKSLPKGLRRSVAIPERLAIPEKTTRSVNGTAARLWSMFDGFTAEIEVLDFLYVITRMIKPYQVLETGTWLGLSSCAIGRGLIENGFGRLTTLEVNNDAHQAALENFKKLGVSHIIEARLQSSMEFTPDQQLDMALFDSELSLRVDEFERFLPWLKPSAIVIFHDTSPHHGVVLSGINALMAKGRLSGLNFPTPRGIFVGSLSP